MMAGFQDILSHLSAGGGILWPLALVCFLMWAGIFERLFFFRRLLVKDLPPDTAVGMALDSSRSLPCGEGLSLRLIEDFRKRRSGTCMLDRSILRECGLRIRRDLNRGIPQIQVLAAVSPLFGLLGTVKGMIVTFDVMAFAGTGDARGMAAGISEALVTTQCGLMVAIPGIIMAMYLTRQARRATYRLDRLYAMLERQLR
ncbi:MotA/TolQ/ExbB proton channel family protein [Desulfobotulus mexicanus]|uniref:MotA/TolQ/ExbB proton channel family protein n=1 Tax=Desulfobotulus mexicanus TaxID=2586642 RepID=A0A5S5MED2_9BACT|nr:MotA/TolQ/ExbB proton channel family protein [Desulfobotulus mexicanus]TYT74106.1 MotA/TolQ/ExbB proton channel family protein [Desulfobotulus mexicanus]